MKKYVKIILVILFCIFSLNVSNTNIENMEVNYTTEFNYEEYIDTYIDSLDLKYDHQREFFKKFLPVIYQESYKPSIATAQSILESNWGRCSLSKHNNLFGVKGNDVYYSTQECVDGTFYKTKLGFREFDSIHQQIEYHNEKWAKEMQNMTIDECIDYLSKKNYATDPNYGKKIKRIIKQYKLEELNENITTRK